MVLGGEYVNKAADGGYFAEFAGGTNSVFINPVLVASTYASGKAMVHDAASNFSVAIGVPSTAGINVAGNSIDLAAAAGTLRVAGKQVVGAPRTGWGAPGGTASRVALDPRSVTLQQLAQRVKALIDDLFAYGLINK